MLKKTGLVVLVFILFLICKEVEAKVVLNEVKLYPTEDRFIELYNQDDVDVDLTGFYIQRKTQTGTSFNSLVSNTYFENKKINAKSYFLISRNLINGSDIILSNLTITESNTIQIKNDQGEIVDKFCFGEATDCGGVSVANPIEGQSVGLGENGMAVFALATPRAKNYVSTVSVENAATSNSSTYVNQTISDVKNKIIDIPKIETHILSKNFAFAGIPILFNSRTTGYLGEELTQGKYFWNFGDGDSKEINANNMAKFSHIFSHEGEYVVSLEYYKNFYSENPDALDKITIKVVLPEIIVSRVGDVKDFYIEIFNNTNYEIDLSGFVLSGNLKNFTFPKNTILSSKKKIILSSQITGFSFTDGDNLKLLDMQWKTIYTFSPKMENVVSPIKNEKILSKNNLYKSVLEEKTEDVKTDVMLASVINSDVPLDTKNNLIYWSLLSLFLIVCALSVYFIRVSGRKTEDDVTGGDFEILDE
ncbi:MAG: lamin tail domain-containing protein [Burkholderiales bacterium]|nr:lamin tail domain-containing protein [Burkholderiales bacterium]